MTVTHRIRLDRRRLLAGTAAVAAGGLAAPAVLRAQTGTLKVTTWGGKWGDIMKGEVIPAFEKEHNCTVQVDSAFPYIPKLQASPRGNPIYDVLQTNSNEAWAAAVRGLIEREVPKDKVPNAADVYPYAVSDKIAGIVLFTSAIGLGYRTDQGITEPASWQDLWERKYDGVRAAYAIPVNSLGQALLMMSGKIFGGGLEDLEAGYAAMERLKPVKLVDFTGAMEKLLLSGEAHIGVIHDSGIYRYDGENQPIDFSAPGEGVMALEQVFSVTPGSQVKELAYAYLDFMLRPDVQKKLAQHVWYSPANSKVELDPRYAERLFATPEKVAQLIQMPWLWYNERKDRVDDRVRRIFES
jgi:putative spermidine/putrescine transport system substrate-binding protein